MMVQHLSFRYQLVCPDLASGPSELQEKSLFMGRPHSSHVHHFCQINALAGKLKKEREMSYVPVGTGKNVMTRDRNDAVYICSFALLSDLERRWVGEIALLTRF